MTTETSPKGTGKFIFICFLAFFGIVTLVNSTFIYMAIHTNSGVVTENAYEKGLAYNKVLEAARAQPALRNNLTYQSGKLKWEVSDEAGAPLKGGKAVAFLVRPIKDGSDFSLALTETAPGIYEGTPEFPVQGLWSARLDMQWNKEQYQTAQDFIVK